MSDVSWIGYRLVIALHERQIAEHGGLSGIRDDTLLQSALAKPLELDACGDPPPDLSVLAASLACGLARNHPFLDGNKRTAAVACETFLRLNGVWLDADDLSLYLVYISISEGSMEESAFADWLHARIKNINRVQER